MKGVILFILCLLTLCCMCNTLFMYDLSKFTMGYYKFGSGATRITDTANNMANIIFLDVVYLAVGMCKPTSQYSDNAIGGWIQTCTLTPFNTPMFNIDQSFSVCIWEFLNTQQTAYVILEISNTDYVFKMGYNVNSQMYTEITIGGVTTTTIVTTSAIYSTWTYICVSFSPTQYVLYINTVIQTTKPLTIIKDCNQIFTIFKRQAVITVSELRLFNKTLNTNDVNALYTLTARTDTSLDVICISSFTCDIKSLSSICPVCDTGFYKAVDPYTYCTTYTPTVPVTYCFNCTKADQCVSKTYLNFECDGTNTQPNACVQCSTGPCPENTYRQACGGLQDSTCSMTRPSCPIGYYLSGGTEYTAGVCSPCTTCIDDAHYAKTCGAESDAICNTGCSTAVSCSNARTVCVLQSMNTNGDCYTCPDGYYVVDNICVECTKGTICNQNGVSLYNGRCPYLYKPFLGGSGIQCASSCNTLSYNAITTKYVSNYIDMTCTSNPVCLNGYYLKIFPSTNNIICTACSTSLTSVTPVTPGLFIHDALSCIWETSPRNTGNTRGYYGSSNTYIACTNGYTSEVNNALIASDCKICPVVNTNNMNIIDYKTCEWNCADGSFQLADRCMTTTSELQQMCSGNGYSQVLGTCVVRPLPFQPAGSAFNYYNLISYNFSYAEGYRSTIRYNPFIINTPLLRITTTTKDYFSDLQYNTMTVNLEAPVPVPGKVCSATVGQGVVYVVYCDMSIIFYLDTSKKSKRLIGSSTNGYQEGMKNDALFESELYIHYVSDRLLVLDTLNCMIREVIVPTGLPGDFRTKSYWVYGVRDGNNKPVCSGANSLTTPRYWFPLLSSYIAFVNNYQYICQYQTINKRVLCLPMYTLIEPIEGLFSTANGYQLFIEYEKSYTVMNDPGQPCNILDYTSVPGGMCDVYRPWNNGAFSSVALRSYYIINGIAYECIAAVCGIGEYASPCARDGPSMCITCQVSNPNTIRYTTVNTCDYVFAPPCPINTYADSIYQNCIVCPDLMYTNGPNKTSVRDCVCPFPLISENNNNCVVPPNTNLFPTYQPNTCPMTQYRSTTNNLCTSCMIAPCDLPNIGEYPTACNGAMSTCVIPANSYATSMGLFGVSTSCSWACNNGYYKSGSVCVVCSGKPDNTYYSDGCLWSEYV